MKTRLMFALVLICGVAGFAWCGGSQDQPAESEQVTFTYWHALPPLATKLIRDGSENLVNVELEKRTGIHMEYIHPAHDQAQESFNLMVSSGDLPDIIQHVSTSYPGGGDKAIDDGVYLRLNELIDNHVPNLANLRDTYPEIGRQTITDSGNIWGFPMLEIVEQPAYKGPAMREDWLDELGLPIPTTIDDWNVTLRAFKEEMGAEYPFLMDASGVDASIVPAFGVDRQWTQRDGRAVFGPIEEEFRQYLTLANDWYNEGLIDPEFVNARQNMNPYLAEGVIGAWYGRFYKFTGHEDVNPDPNFRITAVPYPSLIEGEEARLRQKNRHNRGCHGIITTANWNPEKAAEWFNYLYSEEGTLLLNYGLEGISHTMVNGAPQWTDLMTDNPDGYTINELMNKYTWQSGPYLRDWESTMFTYSQAAQDAVYEIWKGDTSYNMPMVSLTTDEGTLVANVMSDIDTYVSEMIIKFVNGSEPLSEFDAFVAQVKSMGVDEAIAAYQAALDRYYSR